MRRRFGRGYDSQHSGIQLRVPVKLCSLPSKSGRSGEIWRIFCCRLYVTAVTDVQSERLRALVVCNGLLDVVVIAVVVILAVNVVSSSVFRRSPTSGSRHLERATIGRRRCSVIRSNLIYVVYAYRVIMFFCCSSNVLRRMSDRLSIENGDKQTTKCCQ